MYTLSTHPNYVSIKPQNIDISPQIWANVLSKGPLGVHAAGRLATRAILIAEESAAIQRDFIGGGCRGQVEKDECQVAEAEHCLPPEV
jgi:hypothetical protein